MIEPSDRMISEMSNNERKNLIRRLECHDKVKLPAIEDIEIRSSDEESTESLNWVQRRAVRDFIPDDKKAMVKIIENTALKDLEDLIQTMSENRSDNSLNALRMSTTRLMSSVCEQEEGRLNFVPDSNSLVVGEIQAGKTTSMQALAAAATSLGTKIVIVLAGLTDKLRNQTQERFNQSMDMNSTRYESPTLEYDLVTYRSGNKESELIWHPMRSRCRRHLVENDENVLLLVVKKNKQTLNALRTLLDYLDNERYIGKSPILILDDECDHASLNTLSDLYDGNINEKGSSIHKAIVDIRTSFNCIYFGYTATPQAECIGMNPDDPLYPDKGSVHVLDSHEYYLGPLDVFNKLRKQIVDPCLINDLVIPQNSEKRIEYLRSIEFPPQSLIDAMINHGISGALHHLQPRDFMPHGSTHSMLIHICREIEGQEEVRRLSNIALSTAIDCMEKYLDYRFNTINSGQVAMGKTNLLFFNQVENAISRFTNNRIELRSGASLLPEAEKMIKQAMKVLKTSQMRLLNSISEDNLDYAARDCPENMIVIGGDILSRGLSIHGLRTTYYSREPKTPVMDAALQTARWFGPLKEDKDLISIHMTDNLAERFEGMAWDNAGLRDELRRIYEEGLSLVDAKIRYNPKYRLSNKSRHGEVFRRVGDRISVKKPYIGDPISASECLRNSLDMLGQITTPDHVSKGVIWRFSLKEMTEFLEMQKWSLKSSSEKEDMLYRIKVMREEMGDTHHANIVLRNGKLNAMTNEIPTSLQGFDLRRVRRGSKDKFSVDTLASGRTPGKGIETSDWYIDGCLPRGPTSRRRGWRSTEDPVLLIIYIVGKHPIKEKRLKGNGPHICFAAQFPHSGPGGSIIVNKHRRRD